MKLNQPAPPLCRQTHKENIAVPSRRDHVAADDFGGGIANKNGAEHIDVGVLKLPERRKPAVFPLPSDMLDYPAGALLRQTAQKNVTCPAQMVGPTVARRIV